MPGFSRPQMSAKLFVPFLNSSGLLFEVELAVLGAKLLLGVFNLYFDKSLGPAGLHFCSSWDVGRDRAMDRQMDRMMNLMVGQVIY